jgi:membrane protease YdiL (CAAX protease family)
MIGIIVQLALSWLIIWLFEKGNLSFLGFYPTKRRLFDFVLFFLITAFCCSTGFFLRMYFGKEQWELNNSLTPNLILEAVWWNIKSVLFEELIFRGVIFYILIKKFGSLKAIFISSIAFGIYHWFSHEVIGNPAQMAMTFFITGIMGLLYAYGYAKTFTLYIPCAIHLGWNLTQGFVFSQGPIGKGIFIQVMPQPIVHVSYLVFFIILLVPMLSTLLINSLILRRRKQAKLKS